MGGAFASGVFAGIIFSLWALICLDDQRVRRGHFEHRGAIYLIEPGRAVKP